MYVLLFYYYMIPFHKYGLCGFWPLGMGKNLWRYKFNLTCEVGGKTMVDSFGGLDLGI